MFMPRNHAVSVPTIVSLVLLGLFIPAIASAQEVNNAHQRMFLQQQIQRVRAAIQSDERLATRQGWAAPIFRGTGELSEPLLKNSPYETDQKAAPYLGPVLRILGNELGSQVDRARTETEARLKSNRLLLQKYQSELNALSRPVRNITPTTLPAPPLVAPGIRLDDPKIKQASKGIPISRKGRGIQLDKYKGNRPAIKVDQFKGIRVRIEQLKQ